MDVQDLTATLISFGLVGVGCLALAEKLIPVLPSYVLFLLLGMTIVPDMPALALTAGATTAGSAAGALVWYGFGRMLGAQRIDNWVARYGGYLLIRPALYRGLANAYRSNHFRVTLIGQTIPVVRVYLALPAGVLGLRLTVFFIATVLGSLAWNLTFLSLGYGLRHSGQDPAVVGTWTIAGVIAVELAVLAAMRFVSRPESGASSP